MFMECDKTERNRLWLKIRVYILLQVFTMNEHFKYGECLLPFGSFILRSPALSLNIKKELQFCMLPFEEWIFRRMGRTQIKDVWKQSAEKIIIRAK